MTCPSCGHESAADDRFCGACGVPLSAEAFESIITESYPDKLDPNAAKSLVRIRLRAEMYREFYS